MSVVFPFSRPLVLGHRGDCAHAPENTLAAFRLALESGTDGIEPDARQTRDKAVIVLHDSAVDRVSNGHGRLAGTTMAEVACLDAGAGCDCHFASRQKRREILVWGVKTPGEVRSSKKLRAAVVVADDPRMARSALEGQ
jgi:glycerophosphoryl diester phosphodiesterase